VKVRARTRSIDAATGALTACVVTAASTRR
jgi:hypothetical protein